MAAYKWATLYVNINATIREFKKHNSYLFLITLSN